MVDYYGGATSAAVIAGAVIGLGGTVVLIADAGRGSASSLTGDLLLVLSVFLICSVQLTLRRIAQQHGQPALVTALMMTGASVSTLAVLAVVEGPVPLTWVETASTKVWFWFLYSSSFRSHPSTP